MREKRGKIGSPLLARGEIVNHYRRLHELKSGFRSRSRKNLGRKESPKSQEIRGQSDEGKFRTFVVESRTPGTVLA